MNYRTLLIDLDPQGNASTGVGWRRDSGTPTTYDLLGGELSLDAAASPTVVDLLSVVPANTDLAGAEVELVEYGDGREIILRDLLRPAMNAWDYIIIDCPPSLGMLTINAFTASDSILIPVQAEYYALEGLARLLDTINLVKRSTNRSLRIEGLVLTMHDARNNLSRQVEAEVREHFPQATYTTVIPRNVRLSEAPSFGEPIITYDVTSRGARSYIDLAREFVVRDRGEDAHP